MNKMIDKKKLIEIIEEQIAAWKPYRFTVISARRAIEALQLVRDLIENQTEVGEWIPVTKRLPKEHEKQHDIYDPETLAVVDAEVRMQSDTAQVTVEDDNGERFVSEDITIEGEWETFREDIGFKVMAWRSMPEPYWGDE